MEKIRLLLYCIKSKPYLFAVKDEEIDFMCDYKKWHITDNKISKNCAYNGKIVAECDFEVEEIRYNETGLPIYTLTKSKYDDFVKNSCLTIKEAVLYLNSKNGYAIHIKNLHIFDKPRELRNYTRAKSIDGHSPCWHCKRFGSGCERCNIKAPQNMMYIYDKDEKKVLISIRPEYLVRILNGEKTIEIRKKVLKEMIK